ncbi:MAG: tetratricopeptide repeat protein [Planctomycetes bacterium]|nr:tetratricopeptide repeat protein [Planctomycetota bacterium]
MSGPLSTPATADELLGRLAVECGFLTEAQLRLACAERDRPPSTTSAIAAPPPAARRLADVLPRRGLVSAPVLDFLGRLARCEPVERGLYVRQRHADAVLARELVSRGLLTPEQANDCLVAQLSDAATPYLPLPEVLVRRDLLAPDDLGLALPAHSTRILLCKGCRSQNTFFAYPIPVPHRCRACDAPLDTPPVAEATDTVQISTQFRESPRLPVAPEPALHLPIPSRPDLPEPEGAEAGRRPGPAPALSDSARTLPPSAALAPEAVAAAAAAAAAAVAPRRGATEPPQPSIDAPPHPTFAAAPRRPAAPEPSLPAGRPFGKYVLTGELGRGGMGVVYRAYQTDLRREVALKALSAPASDEHEVKRFYNEARLAARLVHPNIVPIYDVGIHEGTHFFTMELIEGPTLLERLGPSRLPVPELLAVLRDVANGVQYAHDQGIVHRDLKPQNILLDASGKPRITDFGLARELRSKDRMTVTGTIMGTPSYMSPEQANGDREAVGPKSDVYSLGAILYHGLAGRAPHEGDSLVETVYKVIDREPDPVRKHNPKAPGDAVTICMKALEKEPARRYPSASALADDLRRYLEGEPIQARPTGSVYRMMKRLGKNRALTAVSVVSVLLLAGGGAWFLQKELAHRVDKARAEADKARVERELADARRRREDAKKIFDRAVHHQGKEAVELFTKAIETCPEYAEAYFARGVNRRSIGEYEGAIADFGEAVRLQPGFTNAYLYRGLTYDENLGKKEEAMRDYAEVVKVDPESETGYLVRGKSLAGDGKHEAAIQDFTRALEKAPKYVDAFLSRGASHSSLRHYDAALRDVDRALSVDPRAFAAHFQKGRIHEAMHRLRDAVTDYARALAIQPLYPDALTSRAYALANLGDFDSALNDFRAALVLQRDNANAVAGTGYVLVKLDRPDEAAPWIARAIQMSPKSCSAWNNKGLLLAKRGDRKGALEAYGRAIEFDPDDPHARRNRANVYFDEARYADAVEDLNPVLAKNPAMANVWHLRGACLVWLRKYRASILDWEKFLELSPSDRFRNDGFGGIATCKMYLAAAGKPVTTARDRLEVAKKKLEAGDPEGAAAECRAAVEANPRLYTPHVTLARLAATAGRVNEAVTELQAAAAQGFQDFLELDKEPAFAPVLADERIRDLRK